MAAQSTIALCEQCSGKLMMGEEVFQLHVATSTYATRPMSLYKARQETRNRVFFPYRCTTGSSFSAGVQQGLLSLLMHYRVFLPCLCITGSSSPAVASKNLLSLLVLHKFPTLNFAMATKQTKWPLVIKHIKWVENHQMIITATSLQMLWRKCNLNIFPLCLCDLSVVIATKHKDRSPLF